MQEYFSYFTGNGDGTIELMLIARTVQLEGAKIFSGRRQFRDAPDGVDRHVTPGGESGIPFRDTGRSGFEPEIVAAHRDDVDEVEPFRHRYRPIDELRVVGAEDGGRGCIAIARFPARGQE